MASSRVLLFAMIVGVATQAQAQSPTYGLGRTPTPEELRAWDISISPDGHELPPGQGTAKDGAKLYVSKGCAGCHGAGGYGGRAPVLIKPDNMPAANIAPGAVAPEHAGMRMAMGGHIMATHSPFAPTIWDYISRGMPLNREGTLKPDEVYSLTAFLLFKNGVIKDEDQVLDQQSLPKVQMPNAKGWVSPPPDWKRGPRLQGYPY